MRKAQKLLNHVPLILTMKLIIAIIRNKIGVDPTICSFCGSPNIVTQIIVAKSMPKAKVVPLAAPKAQNRPPPIDATSQRVMVSKIRA